MIWTVLLVIVTFTATTTGQAVIEEPVYCDDVLLNCQNEGECFEHYVKTMYSCQDELYNVSMCSVECSTKVHTLMLDPMMESYFTCECRDNNYCQRQKCKFLATCLGGDCDHDIYLTEAPQALFKTKHPNDSEDYEYEEKITTRAPIDIEASTEATGPLLCDEVTYICKYDETCEPLQNELYNVACQEEIIDPGMCSDTCKRVAQLLLQHPAMAGYEDCKCEDSPYCREQKCKLLGACYDRECPDHVLGTPSTPPQLITEAGTDAPVVNGKPPIISGPPVNITVPPGGTARFDCTAMAATTPQITITKQDQTTIPDLDNFVDATGNGFSQTTINSITINNVDYPNEGWYTCQAVNKYGYVRHDAYLHVEDLCIGSTCTGEKTCKGNYDTGVGYTCECPKYCGYDELFKQDYVCSNYCEEWYNECQMKTDACQNDKFAISIMNSGRCGRIEAPEIQEGEEEYGVKELIPGEELVMSCHATGFPEPDIKWYRGTTMVGEGNDFSLTVNEADTGEYVCEAVNCMNAKVNKRLAMVFVNEITTPPAATTPTEYTTPTAEMDLANNELPDPARSTCAVFGDPHFLTYDQRPYSYMGTCDNVLAMDCEMGRWFVYGRMRPCGKTGGSCLETVTAYVDSEVLELQRGWLVNQNGGKIVPKNHPNKKITVNGRYNNFTLLFDGAVLELSAVLDRSPSALNPDQMVEDKLVIKWDGYVSVQIQTPQRTRTCGMCGNNDGNPANDMRMRRRGMTDDPLEFGESWKIDPRRRCKEVQPSKTPEEVCGDKYEETKAECERIFNTEKLKNCQTNQGHDTAPWIESCIYDECEGLMQRDDLPPKCIVAGAYVMRCSNDFWDHDDPIPTRNPHMEGWEEEAQCPDAAQRLQPVLDTGCPQPTLEEELAGEFK